MSNRKNLMKADQYGQLLMLMPLAFLAVPGHQQYAFVTYFSVGIWQTMSCYTTALKHRQEESSSRYGYRMIISWTWGLAILGILLAGLIHISGLPSWMNALGRFGGGMITIILLIELVLSPVLAIWYFTICRDDLKRLRDTEDAATDSPENIPVYES